MNDAMLICWTSTGEECLRSEHPTLAEARVFKRDVEDGEVRLVRQEPDSASGCLFMTPRSAANARGNLRAGMTGVKIPGHVGTWKVVELFDATDRTGDTVHLATVEHERIASVRLVVGRTTCNVYAIIRPGWKDAMKNQKGIDVP